MAHKKYRYYAVTSGVEKGIFDDWEKCRMQVDHYKGNCYKGFYSFEETAAFMEKHMGMEECVIVEVGGRRGVECVKDLRNRNMTA